MGQIRVSKWANSLYQKQLQPFAQAQADATPPIPVPATQIYPLGKYIPAPKVEIDVTEAPQAKAWADQAAKLVTQWFPLVCQDLATETFKPPTVFRLEFKKELSAPAYTAGWGKSGAKMSISVPWITSHPDDFGMIIHEMTHAIQAYPENQHGDAGWLVEGIADYIRFWRYEPDVPRPHINPAKASYHDAYRTTAAFLAWTSAKYNRSLVYDLDAALKAGQYKDELFKTETGKTVDDLWAEFIQGYPQPVAAKP